MSSLKKGILVVASLSVISLGTAAVVASFASAAGAVAGKASISLAKRAELLARGAAVGVPVSVTCTAPTVPSGQSPEQSLTVQLSEVVADNVVQQGFGAESEFTCDGSAHTVTIFVTPGSNIGPFGGGSPVRPFTDGTAFASAQLSLCSFPGFIPPPFPPFASPSPLPPPTPIPSPPPGPPGFPSCQLARSTAVISIQGDNEG